MQQGRETAKGELGVLVGQVRRLLSVASVRAQTECLLSKLRQAGGGWELPTRGGNRRVDQYGDQVQAARGVEGDDWRKHHANMKMMLSRMLRWARMPFQCEVFNMFAHLIPQEGLSRMERGRKRQGLVPDFLLELDGERGQKKDELAELKVICCCPSRYKMIPPPPPPHREFIKAVDRRARVLTEEYVKKVKKVDRVYGGAAEDTVGRVQRKLEGFGDVRGLVFSAFGEAS